MSQFKTEYRNSGNCNSRNCNSGDLNSGKCNSGDCNSGDYNSGYFNSGDYNSGDYNSGFFNTDEPNVRLFNRETNLKIENIDFPSYFVFDLTEWVDVDDMTDREKIENPDYETTGGYLKEYSYKEAWKKSFEEKCDKEQSEQTINLPNFDYDIFEEITGITKKMLDDKRGIKSSDKIKDYKYIKLEDMSKESLINIIKKLSK